MWSQGEGVPRIEFGIFNSLYLPKRLSDADPVHAEHNRLMDEVEWTRAADRAGFKYTWATEHHFLEEYSHLSANESFLAYLAGVTERIHLGSGIINITPPVNHPARIAERVAILDHLSGGRFEFGMGRGSSSTEQRGFGINDPDLTKEMFDEVVGADPADVAQGKIQLRGQVLLDARAQRAAQAVHRSTPTAMGGGGKSEHL
jgi:alkanesulfonate monooxygenase SsuD/methylene tetrahydromethanopterin reductase-like flavin-dependent oxidoreductase (luciferase family)